MEVTPPLYGDDIFSNKATTVGQNVPIDDLVKTMQALQLKQRHPCIAAKHTGVNVRILSIQSKYDKFETGQSLAQILVNPEIIALINPLTPALESDLCVPYYEGSIERHSAVEVSFLDEKMRPQSKIFTESAARWVLHGIELLEGETFIDRLNLHRQRSIKSHLKRITTKDAGR
jgi:peptide deformylase